MPAVGAAAQLGDPTQLSPALPPVRPTDAGGRDLLRWAGRAAFTATPEKPLVLGYDASGIVEAVGPAVTLFRPGDAVFYAGVLDRPGSNAALQLA